MNRVVPFLPVIGALLALSLASGCAEERVEPPLVALPATAAAPLEGPGAALVEELGCGACHAGLPPPREMPVRAPPLDGVGRRLPPGYLFTYLRDPVRVRGDIGRSRMPDFRLDEAEALALTLFLAGLTAGEDGARGDARSAPTAELEAARGRHPGVDARLGARIFVALNCAGCHTRSPGRAWPNAPDLGAEGSRVRPEWLRAYLADPSPVRPFGHHPGSGSRMPDFSLSPAELDSLETYLMSRSRPLAPVPPVDALLPYAARKAEALLREKLPCLGCHQIDGEGGRIGPDLSAVSRRLRPEWVVAMIADPQHTVPGTVMPRTPLPAATRELITRYLLRRQATGPAAERLSLADHPIHLPSAGEGGEALYGLYCASCHGPTGAGDGYNARFLPVRPTVHASADSMSARPDDTLFDGIHAGGAVLGRSARMPAFGETLGAERIRRLVAHLRALCDCSGPAWSSDDAWAAEGAR